MKKPRRNYTAEEKVAILKRHLVEKTPVADFRAVGMVTVKLAEEWTIVTK